MSGFFGIVRGDGKLVEEKFLIEMAEALRFRGPGGVSVWTKQELGGCFTRMRTGPAKQAEKQPVGLGDRFWLWGDMRLDGREELRKEISESVHAANTNSQTDGSSEELFLSAWQRWGEAAFEKLIGDFSLALWDGKEEIFWCARDFVGARPFYYAHVGGVFCFSNTLDVLRHVPEISGELDERFIGDFLLEGWNMDPSRTVYRDIRRLPAGHVLKFSKWEMTVRRFQKLPIEEPLRLKRPEDYIESYLELLRLAVRDRMPVGATALYLSGGLDSGSVCAIAAELAGVRGEKERLKAFTVSWEAFAKDEEPSLAKLTARHLGIAHEVLPVTEMIPFEGAETEDGRTPEPTIEIFSARVQRQDRQIAAHSNVALGGDGGDAVLTGQGWPYLVHLWRGKNWRDFARDFGGYFREHGRIPPPRGGFRGKLTRLLKRQDVYEEYPEWLNEDFESRLKLRRRWLELTNEKGAEEHPLHPRGYGVLHGGYWQGLLEMEDAGWNRVRLELRVPLLDLRFLRFLLRLPPVPWCVEKGLCRKAMKRLLPRVVVERPKTPLSSDVLKTAEYVGLTSQLPKQVPGILKEFVKWEKWCETFSHPKGSLSWKNLRPLSLLNWLKAVENAKRIK